MHLLFIVILIKTDSSLRLKRSDPEMLVISSGLHADNLAPPLPAGLALVLVLLLLGHSPGYVEALVRDQLWRGVVWIAVKELKLSYHNGYI